MKLYRRSLAAMLACATAALVALSASAGPAPAPGAAPAASPTNAPPQDSLLPQSAFDITSSPVKDPFFPRSTRTQVISTPVTNAPTITVASFVLKGLGGPPGHPLALINNRTIAVGEEAEVTTPAGKVKIYCVEIKGNTVTIRAENQSGPIELKYEEHYLKF
jgi:hypothetical protein